MYLTIIRKIENIFVFLMTYVVPAAVIIFLGLIFWKIIPIGQQQRAFANMGRYLLIFILIVKPISVIIKRYLNPTYRKLPDGISYLMKGRTQEPILIYIKHLIVNTVYSICLYGLKLRKRLGILSFWAIIVHRGIWEVDMILMGNPMLFLKGSRLIQTGVAGLAALIIGAITSNMFSIKLLQRRRRPLQQIAAYIAFVGACLHIFFIEYERGYIILLTLYIGLKIWERLPRKTQTTSQQNKPVTQTPGQTSTATVSDTIPAKVINHRHLTEDVFEFTVEVHQELKILPGQRVLFVYKDAEGPFNRAYSIADRDVDQGTTMMVFTIKYTGGRGTKLLSQVKIGDTLQIKGVFGHFVLQSTDAPKVFIGTGVGLAAVFNMAKHCETKDKTLIYSVSYLKGLFYEEEIKRIHDLKYEIHITREDLPGYTFGRLDVKQKKFLKDTEFYICGNPTIVEQITQDLKSLGYQNIFSERF